MQLAEGSYTWPGLVAAAILGLILVMLTGIRADAILLGFLLVGYVVGNRGFAQLMPAPGVPLLPAEIGLVLATSWVGFQCAFRRELPFRKDALNLLILAWMVLGTARVLFDVQEFKLLALRDYAVVYYATFFFLTQHMARDQKMRRYLFGSFLVGVVGLCPLFALFLYFDQFFTNTLVVGGVPLIYYKGDLVGTHLAAGCFVIYYWAEGRHRYWAWPLASAIFLFVMTWDSRSSMVGAAVACSLLLAARRWQFPVIQGALVAVGIIAVVALAGPLGNQWANRKLDGLNDRVRSIVDISGRASYESEDSSFKGDNNRFRMVWWSSVVQETWSQNPAFGLGFGYDLARVFIQEYSPEASEDFTARSPHSIFMTAFGRMGLAGLLVWLAFCAELLRRTWHALQCDQPAWVAGAWCSVWVILVSASFGVVLEGPMGAVPFWVLLGIASAATLPEPAPATEAAPDEANAALRAAAPTA